MRERLEEFREWPKIMSLRNWSKQMRLVTVGYAAVMSVVAIKITGLSIPLSWYLLIAGLMFTGGTATMADNNLHDRDHDKKKGKYFASDNEKELRLLVRFLWIVSVLLAAILLFVNPTLGILSGALLMFGYGYSFVIHVKYTPGIYVALVSTGPILYAFLLEPTWQTALLVLTTIPFILGRETLKDIDDLEIDKGYKHTIAGLLGEKGSKVFTGVLYSVAMLIMLVVVFGVLQLSTRIAPTIAIVVASVLILAAVIMLFANTSHKIPKKLGDVSMFIVLCTLFVSFV